MPEIGNLNKQSKVTSELRLAWFNCAQDKFQKVIHDPFTSDEVKKNIQKAYDEYKEVMQVAIAGARFSELKSKFPDAKKSWYTEGTLPRTLSWALNALNQRLQVVMPITINHELIEILSAVYRSRDRNSSCSFISIFGEKYEIQNISEAFKKIFNYDGAIKKKYKAYGYFCNSKEIAYLIDQQIKEWPGLPWNYLRSLDDQKLFLKHFILGLKGSLVSYQNSTGKKRLILAFSFTSNEKLARDFIVLLSRLGIYCAVSKNLDRTRIYIYRLPMIKKLIELGMIDPQRIDEDFQQENDIKSKVSSLQSPINIDPSLYQRGKEVVENYKRIAPVFVKHQMYRVVARHLRNVENQKNVTPELIERWDKIGPNLFESESIGVSEEKELYQELLSKGYFKDWSDKQLENFFGSRKRMEQINPKHRESER